MTRETKKLFSHLFTGDTVKRVVELVLELQEILREQGFTVTITESVVNGKYTRDKEDVAPQATEEDLTNE